MGDRLASLGRGDQLSEGKKDSLGRGGQERKLSTQMSLQGAR